MARHIQRNIDNYVNTYVKDGVSILALAKQENFPPYLISRYLVEKVARLPGGKKAVTKSMRDPIGMLSDPSVILPEYAESELHRPSCKNDIGIAAR